MASRSRSSAPWVGDQGAARFGQVFLHDLPSRPQADLDPAGMIGPCTHVGTMSAGSRSGGKSAVIRTEPDAKLPLCGPFDQAVHPGNRVVEAALGRTPLGVQP